MWVVARVLDDVETAKANERCFDSEKVGLRLVISARLAGNLGPAQDELLWWRSRGALPAMRPGPTQTTRAGEE